MPIRIATLALLFSSGAVLAQADEKPKPEASAGSQRPQGKRFPYRITGLTYVTVGSISYLNRGLGRLHVGTGEERMLISVPKDCQITLDGKPASIDDLAKGQRVRINYGARLHDAVWIVAVTPADGSVARQTSRSALETAENEAFREQARDSDKVTTPDAEEREPSPEARESGPEASPSPSPEPGLSSASLRDQLVKASPQEQSALVERLRDTKGAVNTEALASAIPLLRGDAKSNARDALADRLARMTPATLRDKLRDESDEVRRAATLACAIKDDKTLIPDLIGQLSDPSARVARAARASLKAMTHEDLGPSNTANEEERTRSAIRWREWWTKNGKSPGSS